MPTKPPQLVQRTAVLVCSLLLTSPVALPENPTPSPTPRPGTLGDYARNVTLDTSRLDARDEAPVLGMAQIAALAGGGSLIAGTTTPPRATPSPTPSPQDRTRWRTRVFAQRRRIETLMSRRDRLVADIGHLESGRLTAAVLARIERKELELEAIDREIRQKRLELARLVRAARQIGAEPGWFR